jgi:hypothetical protein
VAATSGRGAEDTALKKADIVSCLLLACLMLCVEAVGAAILCCWVFVGRGDTGRLPDKNASCILVQSLGVQREPTVYVSISHLSLIEHAVQYSRSL